MRILQSCDASSKTIPRTHATSLQSGKWAIAFKAERLVPFLHGPAFDSSVSAQSAMDVPPSSQLGCPWVENFETISLGCRFTSPRELPFGGICWHRMPLKRQSVI